MEMVYETLDWKRLYEKYINEEYTKYLNDNDDALVLTKKQFEEYLNDLACERMESFYENN